MDNKNLDVIIVGGGLAGLMLGYFLKKNRPELTFRILEKRERYTHDRHWAFWLNKRIPFEFPDLLEKTYPTLQVNQHHISSSVYDYAVISSGKFYAFMAQTLKEHIRFSQTLQNISKHSVTLCGGEILEAEKIFSSVPKTQQKIPKGLWQKFYGWHVKAENPIFSPEKAVVMDFFKEQPTKTSGDTVGGAFGFNYVLPFSSHEALIEPTVFSSHGTEEKYYFETIRDDYLKKRGAGETHVLHTETACLPMAVLPLAEDANGATPIGAAAGWLRPATGYSFLTALRLAEKISQSQKLDAPPPYSKPLLAMDKIFLTVAQRTPECMPSLFANWFTAPQQDSFIRFLQNENMHFNDVWEVVRHTPYKRAFLKALLTLGRN